MGSKNLRALDFKSNLNLDTYRTYIIYTFKTKKRSEQFLCYEARLKEHFTQKWKCAESLLTLRTFRMYMSYFTKTDLKDCSITSFAHQWIICSEWVQWVKWRWITLWLCLLCLRVMCNSPNLTDISTRDTNAALRPAVSFQDHPKQMLIQTSVQVSAFYSTAQSLSCFPAFISGQVSSRFIDKVMKLYVNGTNPAHGLLAISLP